MLSAYIQFKCIRRVSVSPVICLIMQPFEYNIKFYVLIGTKKQSVFHTNTGSAALRSYSARIVQPLSCLTSRTALAFVGKTVQ